MFCPRSLFLLGFVAVDGCQPDASSEGEATAYNPPAVDVQPPIPRIDTLELATKPLGNAAYDAYLKAETLVVVSTDRAVCYPFGRVARAAALTTRYSLFTAKKGVAHHQGDPYLYTLLRFRHSAVKFYDDSEDGATVVSGHVVDPQISLANGVRLGSTLPELLRA